ncbi:hypothetical protein Gotur_035457 [Gossypium turneri]
MSTDINEYYELECSWIGESMSIKEASTYVETSQFLSCLIDGDEVGFSQNGECVVWGVCAWYSCSSSGYEGALVLDIYGPDDGINLRLTGFYGSHNMRNCSTSWHLL